jgi:endonuclease/exonuclease/phosphatase family metal-dependent hydrolase
MSVLVRIALVIGSLASASRSFGVPIEFRVCVWNVESGDADSAHIADRIKDEDDVDVWGLSEVTGDADAQLFEQAAEVGEGADFKRIVGTTGGADRLVVLYNADRLSVEGMEELNALNIGGSVRAPLVVHFKGRTTNKEFLFMVNHLYRSSAARRHEQAEKLNQWARVQSLPIIMGGDLNFDWHHVTGDVDHDAGYDLLTEDGTFTWVRPQTLVPTNASNHQSVLDFVFVSGDAAGWTFDSHIVVVNGDFPDDHVKSDHRPVEAKFAFDSTVAVPLVGGDETLQPVPDNQAEILARLERLENELRELRSLVESESE